MSVVLLVADGCGYAHYSMLFQSDKMVKVFERFHQSCLVRTSPAQFKTGLSAEQMHSVTESASSASAMSCGEWVPRYHVSHDGQAPVQAFGQYVRTHHSNHQIGAVVSSEWTDATPAAFFTNVTSRTDEEAIEQQLLDFECDFFCAKGIPAGPNRYALPKKKCATTLGTKVKKALDQFGDDPFFLLVEESHIDKYSHQNDMEGTLRELQSFGNTVKTILDHIKKQKQQITFIVLSDHATGGIVVSNNEDDTESSATFTSGDHDNHLVPMWVYSHRTKTHVPPITSMPRINALLKTSLEKS